MLCHLCVFFFEKEIITGATEIVLIEDGRTYAAVEVEVIDITSESVEVNIYVSETDITTEDFVELVESDLAAAIADEDQKDYF